MGIIEGLHPEYLVRDKQTLTEKVGEFATGMAYRLMDKVVEATEPFIDRSKYELTDTDTEGLNLNP